MGCAHRLARCPGNGPHDRRGLQQVRGAVRIRESHGGPGLDGCHARVALPGCLAGGEYPSFADFIVATTLPGLPKLDGIADEILDEFPEVEKFLAKFDALPAVQKWRAAA